MKKKVILGILVIFLIALVPLFALRDADFGGSDDAGSQVVEEVDSSYEPWATPILETIIGYYRRRTSGRSGKSLLLYPDRYRRRDHRLYHGPVRGTEEMDE